MTIETVKRKIRRFAKETARELGIEPENLESFLEGKSQFIKPAILNKKMTEKNQLFKYVGNYTWEFLGESFHYPNSLGGDTLIMASQR